MAANNSVTVLAPNGRRQTVKITQNTTILQILEEVCRKHGYSTQKWDITHQNQVLDASSIIRFTGLPNNAQLEMAARAKERESSNITIGLQLESGQRLMGDFISTTTISEIITSLCPADNLLDTVIIYMHQEIHGKENLDKTTLQSLGLNNGRAMLRLLHRDPDTLKSQAHVSSQLNPKSNKPNEKMEKIRKASANISNQVKKAFDPIALLRAEKSAAPSKGNNSKGSSSKGNNSQRKPAGPGHVLGRAESKVSADVPAPAVPLEKSEEAMETIPTTSQPVEEQINFLGERNALIFNQAGAKAVPMEDLPDNFFDLTVDDAKALLRDAQRQREQMEELTTNAQRELNRNKSILYKLRKYRKTIIRIQFPNQMVLQGIFGPLETVEMVKEFVREYLTHPEQEFILYCTPPRKDLNPQSRLVDESLVPSAIIYYSGSSEIKPQFESELVDPNIARFAAIKSRIKMTRNDDVAMESDTDPHTTQAPETFRNDPSTSESSSGLNTNRIKSYTPKWFKTAFK